MASGAMRHVANRFLHGSPGPGRRRFRQDAPAGHMTHRPARERGSSSPQEETQPAGVSSRIRGYPTPANPPPCQVEIEASVGRGSTERSAHRARPPGSRLAGARPPHPAPISQTGPGESPDRWRLRTTRSRQPKENKPNLVFTFFAKTRNAFSGVPRALRG